MTGPAAPVPADAPYTVLVHIPNNEPSQLSHVGRVEITLSGAAATVTSAQSSSPFWTCDFSAGTSGSCQDKEKSAHDTVLTLTVLPTTGGTVTINTTSFHPVGHRVGPDDILKTTVLTPPPAPTGLAPDHGPSAGGGRVTITGRHLTGATAVDFGGVAATAFTVDSDTRITATVPAGKATGKAEVTVTTAGGTGSPGQYTYDVPTPGGYTFAKSAAPASGSTVRVGDRVTYTVTVRQHGDGAVTGARVVDDLSGVLDDAVLGADVAAGSGTVAVRNGKLTWNGDLPVGGSTTITYSVTVKNGGDRRLSGAVSAPDDARGTCDDGKSCATEHTVRGASAPSEVPRPSDELADTGATVLGTTAAGGALLALGGLSLALGRRLGQRPRA
ncbi:hypothetical protein KSE_64930 [Kitasatospora setae KM-6054]|uniref:IPT/TIG domain-containing protein n=2 Tax=Streptomycetaceae TaxID=2062 RepID=E4N269_KITSK|nr:hypothetical protein KSE_64930 [Kitasatospora setae KM-6054]